MIKLLLSNKTIDVNAVAILKKKKKNYHFNLISVFTFIILLDFTLEEPN